MPRSPFFPFSACSAWITGLSARLPHGARARFRNPRLMVAVVMCGLGLPWLGLAPAYAQTEAALSEARDTTPSFSVSEGVPEPVLAHITAHLPALLARHATADGGVLGGWEAAFDEVRLRQIEQALRTWLAVEGYFRPVLHLKNEGALVHIALDAGPQTHVASVDMRFRGVLEESPVHATQKAQIAAAWSLLPGSPFTQNAWEAAKKQWVDEASLVRFAAARLYASEAQIDPDTAMAALKLDLDSGPAFFFGPRHVHGLARYPEKLIERLTPWHEGEPYRREALLSMQSRLQDTPYFSAVSVHLNADPARAEAAVVTLQVSEALPRNLELLAGFSSQVGPRIGVRYSDYNVRDQGWQSSTGLSWSTKEQRFFSDIWLLPDAHGRQKGAGVLLEETQFQGLRVSAKALGVLQKHERGTIQTEVGLVLRSEKRRAGEGPEYTKNGLVAHWRFQWRRVDSLLFPREGHVSTLELNGMHRAFLSSTNALRWQVQHQHYIPARNDDLWLIRAHFGHVLARDRLAVFETMLFRTGGAASVRGHAEHSLGVDEAGAIVGGRFLGLVSAEYQYWPKDSAWGAAFFVDAGHAADALSDFKPQWAFGSGVRWKSPLGPLALDVARSTARGRLHLHFGIQAVF